jgi:hypothetical protein
MPNSLNLKKVIEKQRQQGLENFEKGREILKQKQEEKNTIKKIYLE